MQLRRVQFASSSPRTQLAIPLQIADRSRHLKRGLFFKPDGQRNCVELHGISAKSGFIILMNISHKDTNRNYGVHLRHFHL